MEPPVFLKEEQNLSQRDEKWLCTRSGTELGGKLAKDEAAEVKCKKKEEDEEEARRKLRLLRNDALKVKKEVEGDILPPCTVLGLMDGLKSHDISLDGEELDTQLVVPREFISKKFGGGIRSTFPIFSQKNLEKVAALGLADYRWACLKSNFNPHTPSIPGKPGIYFNCRELSDDLAQDFTWHVGRCRVFSCLDDSQWLHVGVYDFEYAATLTTNEWKGLPHKATWITGLVNQNWGREHRIRIHLRNRPAFERQLTPEQFQEMKSDVKNMYRVVTFDQVMDSFDRGEEAIVAWRMNCVGYEKDLQRHIVKLHKSRPGGTKHKAKAIQKTKRGEAPEDAPSTQAGPRKRRKTSA
ncbi:hypothetical protein AAF712_008709 [Marasmius tenuissimus]|uniref:DUF6697 domain-containing protein n=1 Tax=Marasmius tenuissimus TaxID=585030 RepID=A0ABR2ZTL1_9AGAR